MTTYSPVLLCFWCINSGKLIISALIIGANFVLHELLKMRDFIHLHICGSLVACRLCNDHLQRAILTQAGSLSQRSIILAEKVRSAPAFQCARIRTHYTCTWVVSRCPWYQPCNLDLCYLYKNIFLKYVSWKIIAGINWSHLSYGDDTLLNWLNLRVVFSKPNKSWSARIVSPVDSSIQGIQTTALCHPALFK